MARLLEGDETLAQLLALPPEKILVRWLNYHLAAAGSQRRVHGFGRDLHKAPIGLGEKEHVRKVAGLRQVDVINAVSVGVSEGESDQGSPVLIKSPNGKFVRTPMDQAATGEGLYQFLGSVMKEGRALPCRTEIWRIQEFDLFKVVRADCFDQIF